MHNINSSKSSKFNKYCAQVLDSKTPTWSNGRLLIQAQRFIKPYIFQLIFTIEYYTTAYILNDYCHTIYSYIAIRKLIGASLSEPHTGRQSHIRSSVTLCAECEQKNPIEKPFKFCIATVRRSVKNEQWLYSYFLISGVTKKVHMVCH